MRSNQPCREEELKVYARLASLDEETQERISLKYYHGTRPWQVRKEGEHLKRRRKKSAESNE